MLNKLFGFTNSGSEDKFWAWFVKNEKRLYSCEINQEALFNEIDTQLSRINSDLVFAFGAIQPDGKREFVISAGGISSAFPAVERLHAGAPTLPRWIWVKFRPRLSTLPSIGYGGIVVKADDVRFVMSPEGVKVSLQIFMEGYSEQQRNAFGTIGFLMLDNALGEYAVGTRIGAIEFMPTAAPAASHSLPLKELAAAFDNYFKLN